MDLRYNVIIDTSQAESATQDISDHFERMGKSSNKAVKNVADFGNEIIRDMKSGKLSTQEAQKSITALKDEIRRMMTTGEVSGKKEKQLLRQTSNELQKLERQVKHLERTRRNSHTANVRQLKEEQREHRKVEVQQKREEAMEMRSEARRKRMVGLSMRRMGSQLRGTGLGELGSLLGTGSMLLKMGGIGAIFTGLTSILKRYTEDFQHVFEIGQKYLDEAMRYVDTAWEKVKNLVGAGGDAYEVALRKETNTIADRYRDKMEEFFNYSEIVHSPNSSDKAIAGAIRKLRTLPGYEDLSVEEIMNDSKENQFAKIRKYFEDAMMKDVEEAIKMSNMSLSQKAKQVWDDALPYLSFIPWIGSIKMIKDNKQIRDKAGAFIEENEIFSTYDEKIADVEHKLKQWENSKNHYDSKDPIDKQIDRDRGYDFYLQYQQATQELKEELKRLKKAREEHSPEALAEAEKKVADQRNKQAQQIKKDLVDENDAITRRRNQAALELARKQRDSDLKSINGIAGGTLPEMSQYDLSLYQANETKKKEMAELEKYRKEYGETEEYKNASERIQIKYWQSVDDANKALEEFEQAINDQLLGNITTAYEQTLKQIEKESESLHKQVDETASEYDETRKERMHESVDKYKVLRMENAQINEQIRLINEKTDADVREIKINDTKLDEYEVERKVLERTKEGYEQIIQVLQSKANQTEEDKKLLDELILKLRELGVELNNLDNSNDRLEEKAKILDSIADSLGNIGNSLSDMNTSKGWAAALGGSLSGIGNAFGNIQYNEKTGKALKFSEMNKGQKAQAIGGAVSAGVEFGVQVWNAFAESAEQSRQALEEWNQKVEDSAHQLAMLKLEDYEYKQRNIFGVEDPYDKIKSSLKKQQAAQEESTKALDKLAEEGQVQIGTRRKTDGKSVGQMIAMGTAAGATIGSAASPIGAAIGAAAGAITGAIAGIFSSRKRVAVYDSLTNRYGEIYDKDTLEINKNILADYEKMDDATKKLIDNAKELLEVQKEAKEEMEQYISDMVGDIGNEISDALVSGFTNGEVYDAIDDVKSVLEDSIASIYQQKIFSAVFGNAFDALEAQLKATKDGEYLADIPETISTLMPSITSGMYQYQKLMEQVQSGFKDIGFDLWDGTDAQEALQGSIASMSEDTATKINGNFFGLKLTTMEISDKVAAIRSMMGENKNIATASLGYLREIAENTVACKRIDALASDLSYIKQNGIIVR